MMTLKPQLGSKKQPTKATPKRKQISDILIKMASAYPKITSRLSLCLKLRLNAGKLPPSPLSDSCSTGEGVARDDVKAAEFYRKAAGQGYAIVQNNLGSMYARGQGVPQDYVQAAEWYRKAAEQGNANAQLSLGASYNVGAGVPQDYVQAYKWFTIGDSLYRPWYALRRWKAKLLRFATTWKMTGEQLAEGRQLVRDWKSRK